MRLYKGILLIQGTYTALTALWALVDIDSFMKITGPKTDIWLVKTVAVILLAIGLTFLTHAFLPKINLTAIVLALSTSLGLAIIDFYYVSEGIISHIYGVDGILQVGFIIIWIYIAAVYQNS
ncbi:MAG: hypothetical protein ACR2KB_16650 [Chitinophagaceae bacterium]